MACCSVGRRVGRGRKVIWYLIQLVLVVVVVLRWLWEEVVVVEDVEEKRKRSGRGLSRQPSGSSCELAEWQPHNVSQTAVKLPYRCRSLKCGSASVTSNGFLP